MLLNTYTPYCKVIFRLQYISQLILDCLGLSETRDASGDFYGTHKKRTVGQTEIAKHTDYATN